MIKEIKISEDEKKRILELHFGSSKKDLISEQYYKLPNGQPYYHKNMVERLPDGAVKITKQEYDKLVDPLTGKSKVKSVKSTYSPGIDYIKFGSMGQIPVVRGTKTYKLSETIGSPGSGWDTGKILGVTTKDDGGYYDEIDVDGWGKVKRYYPTNDWPDWSFLNNNGIPYAFLTPEGDFFHLVLVLTDPTQSVKNVGKASNTKNKNRGWQISYPGYKTNLVGDSGTGYFKTENGQQVPYNITAPIVAGDEDTYDLDTRSPLLKFVESNAGLCAQIILSIVVTAICREPIALTLPEFIVPATLTANSALTRLVIASMISEAIVNVPIAWVYFSQPGDEYDAMGWISLLFCVLPIVQAKLFPNLIDGFTEAACIKLAEKMAKSQIEKLTVQELEIFISKLSMEERALFFEVVRKIPQLAERKDAIANFLREEFMKNSAKLAESEEYRTYLFELFRKQTTDVSFKKSMLVDFTSTLGFVKLGGSIIEKYYEIKNKKGRNILNEPPEKQEEYKENLEKIDKQFELFPQVVKDTLKSKEGWVEYVLMLSEQDISYMIEEGIISVNVRNKTMMYPIRNFRNCEELKNTELYVTEEVLKFNALELSQIFGELYENSYFKQLSKREQNLWKLFQKCYNESLKSTSQNECMDWQISAGTTTTDLKYVDCSGTTITLTNLTSTGLTICVSGNTKPTFTVTHKDNVATNTLKPCKVPTPIPTSPVIPKTTESQELEWKELPTDDDYFKYLMDPNYEGKVEPQKDENGKQIRLKYFIRLKPLILRQNPQNNQTQTNQSELKPPN